MFRCIDLRRFSAIARHVRISPKLGTFRQNWETDSPFLRNDFPRSGNPESWEVVAVDQSRGGQKGSTTGYRPWQDAGSCRAPPWRYVGPSCSLPTALTWGRCLRARHRSRRFSTCGHAGRGLIGVQVGNLHLRGRFPPPCAPISAGKKPAPTGAVPTAMRTA